MNSARFCLLGALLCLSASLATAGTASSSRGLEDCRISAGEGFPGIKARCKTLRRPLDPENPDAGSIALEIAVVQALDLEPRNDPFVPIAGGPGQSSIRFYAGHAPAFERVRRDRDIVLVDQRGTGASTPLDCAAGGDLLEGQAGTEQVIEETRACLDALPEDPRYFTTSVAVRDLEAVREVLGYDSFNLYGVSYGSRVAQHYARRYPGTTRSLILDGVLPPQLALGPGIAIEAQEALEAIFARCAEDRACGERFPGLAEDFAALSARLAARPVVTEIQNPATGRPETVSFGQGELAGATRLLSYHPNTIALLPLLISEASVGNYGPLVAQFLMAAQSLAEELSIGMHNAVVCTEDAPFFGPGIDRGALDATYMGGLQLDVLETACSVWPAGVLDDDLREPLATDMPVLLLSGDADPVTPPAFAELAARSMTNSLHLIGAGQGHGQAGRTCIPEMMAAFVTDAGVDELDQGCLAERQFVMPFFLDFTGPSP